MKLEKNIFRSSYIYFSGFFIFVLAAFWLTYFVKIFGQENYRMHTHGLTLIIWCLFLIIQPYLIRSKRFKLHRSIGKLSYLLVPLIILTTIDLFLYRLHKSPVLDNSGYFSVALVVNALFAFIIFYGLAIYHRKKSTIHARYMICTVFPFFTPVTDRIIHIYLPSILSFLPTMEGNPIAPVAGFLMADLILLGLSIWDWTSHKRWNVFPIALIILLLYHYSVLNFYKFQFWKNFSNWLVTF
jgi:hypothetical protein